MYSLSEIPLPPSTYFVGMLFAFKAEDERYVLGVKSQNIHKDDHVKVKLPGGTGEKLYEEHFHYENALFDKLVKLRFEKKAQGIIYRSEMKRKKQFEASEGRETIAYLWRTLVLNILDKVGYYPLDEAPQVVYFDQKGTHTQYFFQIDRLLDKTGKEVVVPDREEGFNPISRTIIATRLFLGFEEYKQLIHAHKVTAEKYFSKFIAERPPAEEEE